MKKSALLFLVVFSMIGVLSCNKNDDNNNDPCSTNWATELQAEVEDVTQAAQAYALNPTQENCLAYKAAAQAYLDALESYGDCAAMTGQLRVEWEQALEQAQETVDNIGC
jgi:hypothetical protein